MSQRLLHIPAACPCTIVRRLNRFVVEIVVAGEVARAYINNTGRLHGFLEAGRTAYCVPFLEPQKTSHRLFAVADMGLGALIDTRWQMQAFEQAVGLGQIPWLAGCQIIRRDPPLGKSRLDYLFKCADQTVYLETKSAVLRVGDVALYPDCPTTRGRRHIAALTDHVERGGSGIILFIAALPGVRAFSPYAQGDAAVPGLLLRARNVGVMIKACRMVYDPSGSLVRLEDADMDVRLVQSRSDDALTESPPLAKMGSVGE